MSTTDFQPKAVAAFLLAGLLTLVSVGCSQQQAETVSEPVIAVKAQVVSPTNQQLTRSYTGSLEGARQAVLNARLGEAVTEVRVKEGQTVAEDQILIALDHYGPSSSYSQTESVYRTAEKNVKKLEFLYKEGAISESQWDDARTQFEVAKAQFDAVSRLVEIHTPIAGTVTSVKVAPGELVSPGQELATVATTGQLRVKFYVNPDEVEFFAVGGPVVVSSARVPGEYPGRISTVASSADPTHRAFQVEALIDNSDGKLSPGMFVKIDYVLRNLEAVVAVPLQAILTLDNQPTLYVVRNGLAEKRAVTLGADLGGRVVIESGMNPGDTLVTLGQDYLKDGSRVSITSLNGKV